MAMGKRTVAEGRQALLDEKGRQAVGIIERIITDSPYRAGNRQG